MHASAANLVKQPSLDQITVFMQALLNCQLQVDFTATNYKQKVLDWINRILQYMHHRAGWLHV